MVVATREPFYALDPVELDIDFGHPQPQDRGTVALRGLLVLPQLLAASALGVAGGLLTVVGWFAALALGRLPRWLVTFELNVIAYSVRVNAYTFLLVDEYPPFSLSPAGYPIAVEIGASRLSRVQVFFRWLLAIPAVVIVSIAQSGLLVLSPVIWLIVLFRGRTPQPVFGATAAVIRYQARCSVYLSLVTDKYPRRLFGDDESEWLGGVVAETDAQRRRDLQMRLSAGAKRLVRMIVVLGVASVVASIVLRYELTRPPAPNPAVVAAELRLDNASMNAFPGSHCDLRCMEAHERALGEAYFRFASTISGISFPLQKRGQVALVIDGARQAGRLLLAASKSKDAGRAQGIDPTDPADSLWFDDLDTDIGIALGRVGIFH